MALGLVLILAGAAVRYLSHGVNGQLSVYAVLILPDAAGWLHHGGGPRRRRRQPPRPRPESSGAGR